MNSSVKNCVFTAPKIHHKSNVFSIFLRVGEQQLISEQIETFVVARIWTNTVE